MKEQLETQLDQNHDTAVVMVRRKYFTYRYAYVRARDAREKDTSGEDYLVIQEHGDRLVFALCDGVGQSFKGQLGSRLLGDALIQWFTHDLLLAENEQAIADLLNQRLHELTQQASEQVRDVTLSTGLPERVVKALEQKRAIGTESTFVAGLIDRGNDRLLLAWLGDSQLNIWRKSDEAEDLGNTFVSSERWSSRLGPVGYPHVRDLQLRSYSRILAHSDGLNAVASHVRNSPNAADLMTLINQAHTAPASDDISFFELCFEPRAWANDITGTVAIAPLPNPQSQGTRPLPVTQSTGYQIPPTQAANSRNNVPVNFTPAEPRANSHATAIEAHPLTDRQTYGSNGPWRIPKWLTLPMMLVALGACAIISVLSWVVVGPMNLFAPTQQSLQLHEIVIDAPQPNTQIGTKFEISGHVTGDTKRDKIQYQIINLQNGEQIQTGDIVLTQANNGNRAFSKPVSFQKGQQISIALYLLSDDGQQIISAVSVDINFPP